MRCFVLILCGAPEAALRRWFNAAALVRSAAQGGVVVTTASPSPVEQALVRWDPTWFALYELDERSQIGLPPAVRTAAITGTEDDVQAFLAELNLPENVRVTGPVPLDEDYFAHQSVHTGVESRGEGGYTLRGRGCGARRLARYSLLLLCPSTAGHPRTALRAGGTLGT